MRQKKHFLICLLIITLLFSSCTVDNSATQSQSTNNLIGSSGASENSSETSDIDSSSSSEIIIGEGVYEPYATGWHSSPSVGGGFTERYLFQLDGTFYFAANTMRAGDRLRYMDGTWSYENSTIKLAIKRKIVIEGGTVASGEQVVPYSTFIIDGIVVKYEFSENVYEHLNLTIMNLPLDKEKAPYARSTISIDGLQYWDVGVGYEDMLDIWDVFVYY